MKNTISARFTRPADTTAYASGDLVANNVTAGSVAVMAMAPNATMVGRSGLVRRVLLSKSGTAVANAAFRAHFYSIGALTFANGDNGAWSTNGAANYLGCIDVTVDKAFTDGAAGSATGEVNLDNVPTLYAVLEARGAYTPASAEVFTLKAEVDL